ncbi:putative integral membrane protein [Deinobacterium chartae]|uniref:Putative integral membrane protein n=1 Tax=Deinobacterium chartae TaxID=521158 RepID=A0A841HWF9_9DEIO|nr:lipopolysaccharide assembly protein LapA domain-containing protein [Deinobacterium chartae]MBB6097727.1 putative integral membrane protein [Deinobacterium chartae]
MKVVQYLQVLLLLALVAYVLLLQLENPLEVRLPLPGQQTVTAPLSLVLLGALLVGGLYVALLYTPPLLRRIQRTRHEHRRRLELERQLSAALQARLSVPETPAAPAPAEDPAGTVSLEKR